MRRSGLIGLLVCFFFISGEPAAFPGTGHPDRVFIVVMENEDFRDIVGSPDAPYFNRLSGGLLTNYWGVAHPSLPNYLAMMGAKPPLPLSDDPAIRVQGDSFPEELFRHGHSVRAYMQGLPHPGFGGAGYPSRPGWRYVLKHDPFLLFSRLRRKKSWRDEVQPLYRLAQDLDRGTLPEVSIIVPDLCHDMHGSYNCHFGNVHELIRAGDRFLEKWIPSLLRSDRGPGKGSWIFIVWDEGSQDLSSPGHYPKRLPGGGRLNGGGRVPFLWIDSRKKNSWTSDCFANHYSLLETLTEAFSLPDLAPSGERVPLPRKGGPCRS